MTATELVRFSKLNQVRMVRATTFPQKYAVDELPDFYLKREYDQIFRCADASIGQKSDVIRLQYSFNPNYFNFSVTALRLYNCKTLTYTNLNVCAVWADNGMINVTVELLNLPAEGQYFLRLYLPYLGNSGNTEIWYSERIRIYKNISNTVLITYTNDGNIMNHFFFKDSTASQKLWFQIRVQGGFLPSDHQPVSEDDVYPDQVHNVTLLDSRPYSTEVLTIGDNKGVANWLIDILNHVFACDQVFIDNDIENVQYTKYSESKFEKDVISGYPLSVWRYPLIKSDNDYSFRHYLEDVNDPLQALLQSMPYLWYSTPGMPISTPILMSRNQASNYLTIQNRDFETENIPINSNSRLVLNDNQSLLLADEDNLWHYGPTARRLQKSVVIKRLVDANFKNVFIKYSASEPVTIEKIAIAPAGFSPTQDQKDLLTEEFKLDKYFWGVESELGEEKSNRRNDVFDTFLLSAELIREGGQKIRLKFNKETVGVKDDLANVQLFVNDELLNLTTEGEGTEIYLSAENGEDICKAGDSLRISINSDKIKGTDDVVLTPVENLEIYNTATNTLSNMGGILHIPTGGVPTDEDYPFYHYAERDKGAIEVSLKLLDTNYKEVGVNDFRPDPSDPLNRVIINHSNGEDTEFIVEVIYQTT